VNSPTEEGAWLAWGISIPADLFDGYWCASIGVHDEELIAAIRERDPEWPRQMMTLKTSTNSMTHGRPKSPV
jgi:hypothetical protein